MRWFVSCLLLSFLWLLPSTSLAADDHCVKQVTQADGTKGPKTPLPECSYTITNGSCEVTIDRLNPVTPPTIYVYPACKVQVVVTNPYQLETLTLDWKSNTTVVPPDTFQNAFGAVSGNVGKITVLGVVPHVAGLLPINCEDTAACVDIAHLSAAQSRVGQAAADPFAAISTDMSAIKQALLPPPGGNDTPGQPWTDTATWQSARTTSLQSAEATLQSLIQTVTQEQLVLKSSLATLTTNATPAEKGDIATLTQNEASVDAAITALPVALAQITTLESGITGLILTPTAIGGNSTITYTNTDKRYFQSQQWALDYTNQLLPIVKQAIASPPKTTASSSFAGLADASAKQPIVTLTVQFQQPTRLEFSIGLMVPTRPYHSYAKGSDSTGAATAQETTTWGVVPIALVHWRVHEWITKQRPSAFFVSGGVGVNSATSQVEFGAGGTYSYRAFAVSFLADIGRDMQLGGNLTPNGSLGSYTAVPTMPRWFVHFAPAISVRIPLGGSASSK